MKSLFWNIKGVSKDSYRLASKRPIISNNPGMVFIAKPWMNFTNFPKNLFEHLNLKPFSFNKRVDMLLNLWCFCKADLDHLILGVDDCHNMKNTRA